VIKEGGEIESVEKMFVRARESVVCKLRVQTMAEYALILAAMPSWPMASTAC
jgi:hypothetical protein